MELKCQVVILIIFRSFIEAEYLLIETENKEQSQPALGNGVLEDSKDSMKGVDKSSKDYNQLHGWDCDNEKEEKEQQLPTAALEMEVEDEDKDSSREEDNHSKDDGQETIMPESDMESHKTLPGWHCGSDYCGSDYSQYKLRGQINRKP